MMRLIALGFVAVGLFAATTILRSYAIFDSDAAKTALLSGVQATHLPDGTSKLPVQEFENHALIYPNRTSR